jgi:hypothetical protein
LFEVFFSSPFSFFFDLSCEGVGTKRCFGLLLEILKEKKGKLFWDAYNAHQISQDRETGIRKWLG